ncbi:signal transduction histidine kinase [Nocardia pseudobrasiliensis]|uniref:histidine kinase n=1 Tax=Nocardia pseudobrasiliensis TaxID=45979 RepID=A0A370I5T2_9NOCA|nr:signal transduction histidine kinase [Nocardia pseudobrasiliensis]
MLVALVVAGVQLGAGRMANHAMTLHGVTGVRPLDALGYGLLMVGPLLLVVRRAYPLSVFVGALATTVAYLIAGFGYGPIFISLIIAFLTAATRGSRWRTYPFVPVGYLLMIWPLPALRGNPTNGWQMIGVLAWLCVLLAAAEGIRQRREIHTARRQRAEAAHRNEQAERERELAQREQRATEERLAIARELHDVLAHSLSLINVQSSVALELLDRKPEQAATALSAIKQVSRDALGEVHTLLRSIRSGAETVAAPTTPTVGIVDLDALLAPARAAGISVDTEIRGPILRLPALVDVAAARIVQESLTNVIRHAPGARAVVTVDYAPGELRLVVENDRPANSPQPSPGGGNGIAGMIERAHALHGEVTAGRAEDGGFRVSARLPLAADDEGGQEVS